ncbi:MAG TPA: hypothetical protein VFY18_04905 [Candidatus Limnocylindrales bacterium]|nr:hypothetical protein [Candidatus Limnocylindrales bacterium]
MSGTTTVDAGGAQRAAQPGVEEGKRRLLRWRHLWLVPGLAIAIFANALGNANGVGILMLIAFGIAPDLPRLFGSRGRPSHNLLHQPAAPLMAVALAATGVVPVVWLVGSLVWLGHIVAGRAVGDVPQGGGHGSNA